MPTQKPVVSEARRNARRTRLPPANSRDNSECSAANNGHATIGSGGRRKSGRGNDEHVAVTLSTLRSALDEAEREEKAQAKKMRKERKRVEEEEDEDDEAAWRSLMGDDIVMKIVGCVPPLNKKKIQQVQPKDTVLVNYTAKPAKDRKDNTGPIVQQAEGHLVTIADGDVLPAIEMATRFMDAGQTVRVWARSKYAYGPGIRTYTVKGSNEVRTLPPHTDMIFEVTVTQIVVDTSRLNPYFPIQKALTQKKIANDIFQHEWLSPKVMSGVPKVEDEGSSSATENGSTSVSPKSEAALQAADCTVAMKRAIRLYEKAAADMEALLKGAYLSQVDEDHPQRIQARQIMLDTLNNSVAVHLLRLRDFHKAKQAAIRVLQEDPKNVKALLRVAKACLLDPASTLEEAKAAIDAADEDISAEDVSNSKELRRLKAQLKQQQNQYKNKSKAMFSKMMKQSSKNLEKSEGGEEHTGMEDHGTMKVSFWQTRTFGMCLQLMPLLFYILYVVYQGEGFLPHAPGGLSEL